VAGARPSLAGKMSASVRCVVGQWDDGRVEMRKTVTALKIVTCL
jgi:hypothetical protein